MANQHINECIIAAAKKKKKRKTSAHKSIILIGITSAQLVGAPASLGLSSDEWKAAALASDIREHINSHSLLFILTL